MKSFHLSYKLLRALQLTEARRRSFAFSLCSISPRGIGNRNATYSSPIYPPFSLSLRIPALLPLRNLHSGLMIRRVSSTYGI
jgi:hypothetical protein